MPVIQKSLEHNNSYVRCHIYRLSQIPKSTAVAGVLAGSRGRTAAVLGAGLRGRAGDPAPVSVPVPPESTRRCRAVWQKRERARSAWGHKGAAGEEETLPGRAPGRRGRPTSGGRRRGCRSGLRGPGAAPGPQRGAAAALAPLPVPRRRGSCGQGGAPAGPAAEAEGRGAAAGPSPRGRTERAARRNSSLRHV